MTEFEPKPSGSASARASTPTSSVAGRVDGVARRAESIHDFTAKLRTAALWPRVRAYVEWQRALRAARREGTSPPPQPELVPLSINLDLTTACNYRCDHCIDWDILNAKVKFDDDTLRAQIREMAARGLRSVILIGGGEPTLHPGFVEFVRCLKELGLQVAVVSNGSRNDRILAIAPMLEAGDWVRLSLDAGSNETFRAMHKPCANRSRSTRSARGCRRSRRVNPALPARLLVHHHLAGRLARRRRGRSRTSTRSMAAAKRARDAGFDYISFKPFLERGGHRRRGHGPRQDPGPHGRRRAAHPRQASTRRGGTRGRTSWSARAPTSGCCSRTRWRDYTRQPRSATCRRCGRC